MMGKVSLLQVVASYAGRLRSGPVRRHVAAGLLTQTSVYRGTIDGQNALPAGAICEFHAYDWPSSAWGCPMAHHVDRGWLRHAAWVPLDTLNRRIAES